MKIVLAVIVLTLLAAGGGGFLGLQMFNIVQNPAPAKAKPEVSEHAPAYAGDLVVRELPPMLANLVAPESAWIRVQAAIVFSKKEVPEPDQTAAQITNDLVAYLKTLSAAQLQGGSGLQHLREDLNDRVATRTEGHVREVVIETMVVQ
jgi:flagellar protein FliL